MVLIENDFRSYLAIKEGLFEQTIIANIQRAQYIVSWINQNNLNLDRGAVERFLYLKKETGRANGTLNNYLTCLKYIYNYYSDRGIVCENFLQGFKSFEVIRPVIEILSSEE